MVVNDNRNDKGRLMIRRVVSVKNPDNLPVKNILIDREIGIVLPEGAIVIPNTKNKTHFKTGLNHIELDGKEYKHCGHCHKWLRLFEFYKVSNTWDGLYPECVDCLEIYRKKLKYRKARSI